MDTLDRKKIVDKVIKLLALSENNSNTPEAIAARDKAADLMAKYEISISKETLEFETFVRGAGEVTFYKYDTILLNSLSKFNNVVYISHKTSQNKGSSIFVGRKSDVKSNDYMIFVVYSQRDKKWKEFRKEYKSKFSEAPNSSVRADWLKGFSFGIAEKLRELSAMKNTKIQEYGLVVVPLYNQILEEYKKTSTLRNSRSRKLSYNVHGYNAGKSTQINRGVESQQTVKAIGN